MTVARHDFEDCPHQECTELTQDDECESNPTIGHNRCYCAACGAEEWIGGEK